MVSVPAGLNPGLPDPADRVHQAWMQHVRAHLRWQMKLLDVTQGIEAPLPRFVRVPEQAILPEDGGEVGRLFEVLIGQFLQAVQV
jgi:hypothetical protein